MSIQHEHGVESDNKDWFYYSAAWKQWNRILVRGGESQGFQREIAITLTPANNDWDSVLKRRIRKYIPRPERGDIYTHVLPQAVYDEMSNNLEFKRLVWLIDVDILRNVDLYKLAVSHETGITMYDRLMVDGEGDRDWMNTLKGIHHFFHYPKDIANMRMKERLNSLAEKYKTPFPGNPFDKVKR